MALRVGFTRVEALAVGVGMCGRAGLEFVLSAIGLKVGAIDAETFSVLIFTAFLLSLISPVGLKGWRCCCAGMKGVRPSSTRLEVQHPDSCTNFLRHVSTTWPQIAFNNAASRDAPGWVPSQRSRWREAAKAGPPAGRVHV